MSRPEIRLVPERRKEDLDMYNTFCTQRFGAIERKQEDDGKVLRKIHSKVFDGFGKEIQRVDDGVKKNSEDIDKMYLENKEEHQEIETMIQSGLGGLRKALWTLVTVGGLATLSVISVFILLYLRVIGPVVPLP